MVANEERPQCNQFIYVRVLVILKLQAAMNGPSLHARRAAVPSEGALNCYLYVILSCMMWRKQAVNVMQIG